MRFLLQAVLLLTLFTTQSCGDDEQAAGQMRTGEIMVNGVTTPLTTGFLRDFTLLDSTVSTRDDLRLDFVTENISLDRGTDCYAGDGDLMIIAMPNTITLQATPATYSMSGGASARVDAMSLFVGFTGDGDCVTGRWDNFREAVSGEITVSYSAPDLDLEFNFVDRSGRTMSGFYRGPVTETY